MSVCMTSWTHQISLRQPRLLQHSWEHAEMLHLRKLILWKMRKHLPFPGFLVLGFSALPLPEHMFSKMYALQLHFAFI